MKSPSTSKHQKLAAACDCAGRARPSVPRVYLKRSTVTLSRIDFHVPADGGRDVCRKRQIDRWIQEADGRRPTAPTAPERDERTGPSSRTRARSRPGRGLRKKYPWA